MNTELRLQIEQKGTNSEVTDCYFTSPLKIGIPNHYASRLTIYLMMASPGLLNGDTFFYHICCKEGSRALLTEQSYGKIFDTQQGEAKKQQEITVLEGASLYYRPCPIIPFRNSSFRGETSVTLDEKSEFAYADCMAAGRVGMGEVFAFKRFQNKIKVMVNGRLVWLDHCLLEPEHMDVAGPVFFAGFTHQGTFYYYGPEEKQESLLRHCFAKNEDDPVKVGCSKLVAGVVLRILAHSAQDIERIFSEIASLLELDSL